MNQMSQTQPLGPVNFSEEELRKLAMLLQQIPDGEGLATINQDEAELMKSYGGSGTPLPGTQGLGPGGEPVRSYDTDTGGYGNDPGASAAQSGETGQSTTGGLSTSTGGGGGYTTNLSGDRVFNPYKLPNNHPTLNPGYIYGAKANTTVTTKPTDTGPSQDPHQLGLVEDEGASQETFGGGTITHPDGTVESGGTITHPDGTVESAGDGTTTTTNTNTYVPKKFFDKNGNEHGSQQLANTANDAIDANISAIEGLTLTTDTTFTSWMLANKDTYPVPPNSAAQMETAFNNAKIIATDAASVELPKMVENMNIYLSKNGAEVPYDVWAKTYTKPANLSDTTMRTMYAKAVFKAERKEAFTLTTEELESWMRPPVVIATADNFKEWWEGKKGQFKDGTFDDREFAHAAHLAAIIGDAKKVTVGDVDPVTGIVTDMTATAPVMATEGNFNEWWEGKGGPEGLYPTREEAEAVHAAAIEGAAPVTVGDVDPVTGDVTGAGDVTAPTVEFGDDITEESVNAIQSITDSDIDAIFAGGVGEDVTGIDTAEALLVARVEGTAVSPAEVQLKRSVENNLRMLLGATAGMDSDPAKIRQLKNIWVDMTQEVTGKAAEIRSQESMAAEKELVALYKDKSTIRLQVRLANMEVEKETAFKNGDLALAAKLANQATRLAEVITQANIDLSLSEADLKSRTEKMIAQGTMDLATALANLQVKKDLAIAQGKTDVALSLANLQKNILLAQTNVDVAVKQRALDDALAIIAYKGQMAMIGLEVEIDTAQMQADLQEMGFELTRDLAEMDDATQRYVADQMAKWKQAAGNDQKQASIIGALGTVLAAWASSPSSDIRAKTNISPGGGEVESFLDALNAYTYEYKDPDAPGADAGMFAGVMAQDLEKTPMGASFVQDTPNGKMVDYGHGLAAILASQANIHDRLKHLEEG